MTFPQPSDLVQENILKLENPSEYVGRMWTYDKGLSSLRLWFHNQSRKEFFLDFQAVEYFSGAIYWTGANFRLHPSIECIHLYKKERPASSKWLESLEERGFADKFQRRLYSIATVEGNLIQIIAGNFHLTESSLIT
jgi:hypothetical protein